MTSSALKWIALTTMLIDHIGLLFFGNIELFRIIGRISFPIFAFLLAYGFVHTHSRFLYGLRLGLFAIISEIPYNLCMYGSMQYKYSQSVILELFIAYCALVFMEKAIRKNVFYFLLVLVFMALSEFLYASYGLYGVCIILAFYLLRSFRGADVLAFIGLTYLFFNFTNWGISAGGRWYDVLSINNLQMYCLISAVLIVFFNGKRGKYSLKWLFYIFYPVHLIVLYFINVYIV